MTDGVRPSATWSFVESDQWDRILTPALTIISEHVRSNIQRVLDDLGRDPDRWRPHVKTAKAPIVFGMLADAGIRHFKCATTREADVLLATLVEKGIDDADLIVAYGHTGPALRRLAGIARRFPRSRVSVLCEHPDDPSAVPAELGVLADVNPGMDRSGIPLSEIERIVDTARAAGGRFGGLHFYEGHINKGDAVERERTAHSLYDRYMNVIAAVRGAGMKIGEVVTSGTPTYRQALSYARFGDLGDTRHRVSPGTVVYHDVRTMERAADLELTPAAVVVSRVISRPADDVVTCDAGSKAIAAEAGDPCARVANRAGLCALTPSEEHLPLRVTGGVAPQRGDLLVLVPRHVCPTVNLAEQAVLLEGGRIKSIVPVAARAHEISATGH